MNWAMIIKMRVDFPKSLNCRSLQLCFRYNLKNLITFILPAGFSACGFLCFFSPSVAELLIWWYLMVSCLPLPEMYFHYFTIFESNKVSQLFCLHRRPLSEPLLWVEITTPTTQLHRWSSEIRKWSNRSVAPERRGAVVPDSVTLSLVAPRVYVKYISWRDFTQSTQCVYQAWAVTSHLVQKERVEIRHVALVGQGAFAVFLEVLLKGNGVMWDFHHGAKIVRQHL